MKAEYKEILEYNIKTMKICSLWFNISLITSFVFTLISYFNTKYIPFLILFSTTTIILSIMWMGLVFFSIYLEDKIEGWEDGD